MKLYPDPAAIDEKIDFPLSESIGEIQKRNLRAFDDMDFNVFSRRDWSRFHETHHHDVRVHFPDGHFTDGLDVHIKDMDAFFVYAPDTRIATHPIRIAMDEYTAVTGVIKGTFSQPMPDGKGGSIAPTGKAYSLNMATIGRWNEHGLMTEEWLYWDNQTFMQQLGLT